MTPSAPPQINRKLEINLWWITFVLIAINVGLFAWQGLSGVDMTQPSIADAIRWGADFAPLTWLEQPERLFTSMFFHFGLVHLMLNMWALYIFGSISEQIFGRFYFLGLYLLSGLMGSLLSSYINIQDSYTLLSQLGTGLDLNLMPRVGAGASGAVMGVGASLAVLSILPSLPKQRFILDKRALLIIMAINLAFGFFASGINNAAHIGGMIMGAALTLLWYINQRLLGSKILNLFGLALGALACAAFYWYCEQLIQPIEPFWQELLQHMNSQLE